MLKRLKRNQKTLMPTKQQSKKVIVGRLGAAFGVRGQLKVNSYTDPITNILDYPHWQVQHQGTWQPLPLESKKKQGNTIVIKMKGIDDRDIAKAYTNDLIGIEHTDLPPAPAGEYYWSDLEGCTVHNTEKVVLGTIVEMRDTGANDIMVIEGERRHLIPFIPDILQSVDLDQQLIIVDWDDDF